MFFNEIKQGALLIADRLDTNFATDTNTQLWSDNLINLVIKTNPEKEDLISQ